VSLARHLREKKVTVIEVMRPNRQVRRRYGKTDGDRIGRVPRAV